jgi:hypothetical protein
MNHPLKIDKDGGNKNVTAREKQTQGFQGGVGVMRTSLDRKFADPKFWDGIGGMMGSSSFSLSCCALTKLGSRPDRIGCPFVPSLAKISLSLSQSSSTRSIQSLLLRSSLSHSQYACQLTAIWQMDNSQFPESRIQNLKSPPSPKRAKHEQDDDIFPTPDTKPRLSKLYT